MKTSLLKINILTPSTHKLVNETKKYLNKGDDIMWRVCGQTRSIFSSVITHKKTCQIIF